MYEYNVTEAIHRLNLDEAKEDWERFENYLQNTSINMQEYINIFKANKQRLSPGERDIYYWMKQPVTSFISRMVDLKNSTSNTKERVNAKKTGADVIFENSDFIVLHILTYNASKYYGKNTKWCISGNFPNEENKGEHYFNTYLQHSYSNIYFVLSKTTNHKWCICLNKRGDKISEIWNDMNEVVDNIPGLPSIPEIFYDENRVDDFDEIDV